MPKPFMPQCLNQLCLQIADARAIEVGQEEKKRILQQLEQQLALYDAQGAYTIELQGQVQQQVTLHCTAGQTQLPLIPPPLPA